MTFSRTTKPGRPCSKRKAAKPAEKKPDAAPKPKQVDKKPAKDDDFGDILDDDVSPADFSSLEVTKKLINRKFKL